MGDPLEQTRRMIEGMLAGLEKESMQGLSIEDLTKAMSHPDAAQTVAELMPLEATSVQAGEPAPDFRLPYLPASRPADGPDDARVTLSDHFGSRPVALIFGSYT